MVGDRMLILGGMIKMYRMRLRMTKEELSRRVLYKDSSMIGEIEQGKKSPSVEKLHDIAQVLNTTVGALLGEEPGGIPQVVNNNANGEHAVCQHYAGPCLALNEEALCRLIRETVGSTMREWWTAQQAALQAPAVPAPAPPPEAPAA